MEKVLLFEMSRFHEETMIFLTAWFECVGHVILVESKFREKIGKHVDARACSNKLNDPQYPYKASEDNNNGQ